VAFTQSELIGKRVARQLIRRQLVLAPHILRRAVVVLGEPLEELPWIAVGLAYGSQRPNLGDVRERSLTDTLEGART